MARKTIKQRIALDGGKEMETELRKLGAEGEKAFGKIRKAAASAEFANFGKSLDAFGKSLQSAGKRLAIAFAGITTIATGAAAAVTSMAKAGADAADEATKAAQATGLQIEAYGRLQFAADQSGVAQEAFISAMSKFNRTIGEAVSGGKGATEAFKAIGVSIRDAQGRLKPTEALIQDVAQAFAKMPNGAKKSALAMDLFGRSGAQLLPFLNSGKEGLIALGIQAERLGIVFTQEQATIAEAMNDTLAEVSKASNGIRFQLGLLFAPTITAAAARMRDVLIDNREAILSFAKTIADTALPIIEDFISAIAGDDAAVRNIWILEWRDAVVDFGKSAKAAFTDIIIPALSAFKKVLDTAAEAMRIFTGIDIGGTGLAITIAIGQATGAFRLLYDAVRLTIAGLSLFKGHPIIAALSLIGAGAAYLYKTQSNAAIATRQHKEGLDALDAALARVKAGIPGAAAEFNKLAEQQLTAARAAIENAKAQVAIQEQALEAAKQSAALSATGELEKRIAGDIENSQRKVNEFKQLLQARLNEMDKVQDRINSASGEAVKATAEPVKAIGAAVDQTTQKVEDLGRVITVHTSDGAKPVQQVFELVNGVTQAAGESKAQLEGVTSAAQETATAVSEITKSITSVPSISPSKQPGQPGEDQTKAPAGITESLVKPFQEARDRIAEILTEIPALVSQAVASMTDAAAGFGAGFADSLSSPFKEASDRITSILTSLAATVDTRLAAIVSSVQAAVTRLRQSISEMRSLLSSIPEGGAGGGGSRFASGGRVSGPGTGTSDSILARLSDGEFVLRAAAVKKYGTDLLYALNTMRLPKDFLRGFATGGVVDLSGVVNRLTDGMRAPSLIPAFADGGAVSAGGGRPINLNIGGERFELIAPEDVADRLAKHQGRQGLRKAGKKPSWR